MMGSVERARHHGPDCLGGWRRVTRGDYYPATVLLRHGTFRGEVRNVFAGSVVRCSHEHRTRSAALRCAENLFANLEGVEGEE